MNRQIYKMTLSDASDSITFYLLEVPIADDDITGTARNTTIDGNVYEDYLWLKKQWSQKWSIMCKDEYDKLRGIWKRQYTDSEVVSVKYFYGDNIYTDGEVEGDTMQINNDSEVYEGEIRAVKLLGNATQKTLSGKNLFGFTDGTLTLYDVLFTISGTDVSAKGVSSKASYAQNTSLIGGLVSNGNYPAYAQITATNSLDLAAGTYTLSATLTNSGNTQAGLYIGVGTTGSTISSGEKLSATGSKTVTLASGQRLYISVWYEGNASALNVDFKATNIQLEAGTTATAYEPYCGSTPAPNPDFPQVVNTVSGEQTVKITGKNLLEIVNTERTNNDIKFTPQPDGSILVDGTASANAIYVLTENTSGTTAYRVVPAKAGTYTFSANTEVADGVWFGCYTQILGESVVQHNATSTFTIDKDFFYGVALRVNSGKTVNNLIVKPQLELGNQPTSFEGYHGTEFKLWKNMLDLSSMVAGYVESSGTFNPATANGERRSDFIKVKPNTKYSFEIFATTGTATNWIGIGEYTSNNTSSFVRRDVQSTGVAYSVFYTSNETEYIVVSARNLTTATKVQLSIGERTTYSPYITPIELCKIGTYQDYIWNDNGTWKIHKEVGKVDLGSLTWVSETEYNAGQFRANMTAAQVSDIPVCQGKILCSHFTWQPSANYNSMQEGHMAVTNSQAVPILRSRSSVYSSMTANDFKTAMSGIYLYYQKYGTPTDTEITDAELVGQLDALLAGSLYKGLNNVFLIPSAGAQGTMTLDYRIDYEKETVVQDTTPVLLDLTDDGIINACQCRQNVKITMRETVQ